MPTAHDPAPSRSEKKAVGIYIARGADTLGPYTPAEAAALVVGGFLHADDHAARNGDPAWVPLADLLPPSPRETPPTAPRTTPPAGARPPRRRRLAAVILLLAAVPFLVAGGVRWFEGHRAVRPDAVRPSPSPAPEATPTATPDATPAAPAAETPATPPPTPEPDGPLRGSVVGAPAGVRVAAYPLDALEASLAPVAEAGLLARQRLDPQIDAAAAEHATRAAEEQAALQALNDAAPADPLRQSLRFAYNGAKTATATADDNHRFLLEERAAAAGGEVYFRVLPAPAVTAETDAAGDFSLDLPPDGQSYAVAASASQTADDGRTRTRYWLVRLSPAQRSGHAPLRLDDGNALASASDDSLVHTAD